MRVAPPVVLDLHQRNFGAIGPDRGPCLCVRPSVQWLARHPRFYVYIMPTSSSCLNMVERFFRDLPGRALSRGILHDIEELIMAIGDFIDKHKGNPKPSVWAAKAAEILEKVKRARKALDKVNLLAADTSILSLARLFTARSYISRYRAPR
jgi:hypothetical protein